MGFKLEQYRPTKAIIHLEHLAQNVKSLRTAIGYDTFFCPMVKANGYGHGDVEISLRLATEGIQQLGVGLIEEGLLLRQMGVQIPLLYFGIFVGQREAQAIVQNQIIPVLSTWDQIRAMELVAPNDYPVHVKFDTGMHRLGFSMTEAARLVRHFETSKLKITGILTHLHSGEDADDLEGSSFEQLRLFQEIERSFQPFAPVSHSLNSAGCLNFLKHRGKKLPQGISANQGVRAGLAIYGISPVELPSAPEFSSLKLKPVMSLRSETVKYHLVKAQEGVSYNRTWKASMDSVIAVIPVGYADGYHRALSNQGEVLFRGTRVPIVGNVCMDHIMIDITKTLKNEVVDSLKPEPVTLFGFDDKGNQISAAELAKKAGTISWEILTSVGERVPRLFERKEARS